MRETDNSLVNEVLSIRGAALECLLVLANDKNDMQEVDRYLKSIKEAVFTGKVHGLPGGNIITLFRVLSDILEQLQAFYSNNPNLSYSQLK